jgi:hypothetical protein
MALRINLYHEALRAKKQEQYDPLKLSIFGLIAIGIILAGWFFIELGKKSSAAGTLDEKRREYERLTPLEKMAQEQEAEYSKQIGVSEKLQKRMEERFYWAPVLEDITSLVPEYLQINKLAGDVTGDGLRTTKMMIEGIAAGDEPWRAADEFRNAIAEKLGKKFRNVNAVFKGNIENSTDQVTLNGRTLKTVMFSINLSFQSGKEPPPPPPPPRPRGRKVAQENL